MILLDPPAGCGKISTMSRRRTTAKLHSATLKEGPNPIVAKGEAVAREAEPTADADAGRYEETKTDANAEPLHHFLATEGEEREVGEQRTTGMVARYFKLTLAMVCLNVVVAGTNVAMLFSHSGETRTVVVAPAPASVLPAPAGPIAECPPVASPAPPVSVVPSAPASAGLPQTSPPAEKVPLPGRPPLLGKPALQRRAPLSARPATAIARSRSEPEALRPAHAAPIPPKTRPVLSARIIDEDPVAEDSRPVERW